MTPPHRPHAVVLIAALIVALSLTLARTVPTVHAQAPGTTPVPPSLDWNQATLDALNMINAYRAQQQPASGPLQVDMVLQTAAAWEANDQLTNGNCFTQFGGGPANPSPQSVCPHTDSLGRDPFPRAVAFGYTGQVGENANYGAGDPNNSTATATFTFWRDVSDGGTFAHRMNMINPMWTTVGLANQCDAAGECFWVADFGSCLAQAFTAPAGAPPPPTPTAQAPACQQTPAGVAPAGGAAAGFTGNWQVDDLTPGLGIPGVLMLTQTGNQVTGTFSYAEPNGCGMAMGTLTGTVNGTALTFTAAVMGCYSSGTEAGMVALSPDGSQFIGTWHGTRTQ